MPRFDDPSLHGDMYVEYTVVLPATLSNDQRRSKFHHPPIIGLLGLTRWSLQNWQMHSEVALSLVKTNYSPYVKECIRRHSVKVVHLYILGHSQVSGSPASLSVLTFTCYAVIHQIRLRTAQT